AGALLLPDAHLVLARVDDVALDLAAVVERERGVAAVVERRAQRIGTRLRGPAARAARRDLRHVPPAWDRAGRRRDLRAAEHRLHHREHARGLRERGLDRARFEAAVHHAVRARGVAALRAVVLPVRLLDELAEALGIAVLDQVAGLLPAEDRVRGHA